MIMDVGDLLDLTAKKIEEPGWWLQGSLVVLDEQNQPVMACAVGTLRLAAGAGPTLSSSVSGDVSLLISDAHEWMSQYVGTALHWWNDVPGRTADDVATKLRDGAREWRIKHGR